MSTKMVTTNEKRGGVEALLKVRDLSLSFFQYTSGLRQTELRIISNMNLEAYSGEVLAVVGSSGSGKSLLAHAILGILPSNSRLSGSMEYKGQSLTQEKKEELRGKEISLIPQSTTYLDPLMRISDQVMGSVDKKDKGLMRERQRDIFEKYNLQPDVGRMLPHELSGGMARRVLVSTALMSSAELIIADEPTPGLDERSLDETLRNFKDMAKKGCAVILITHDIEAALKISDRIAIFYAGTILEEARIEDFRNDGEDLRHPYTRALWKALPQNRFQATKGHQPMQDELNGGCVYFERCSIRTEHCSKDVPQLKRIDGGLVRCNNVS